MYPMYIFYVVACVHFMQNALCSEHVSSGTIQDTDFVLGRLKQLENKFETERKEWQSEKREWRMERQQWQKEKQQWHFERRQWQMEKRQWQKKSQDMFTNIQTLMQRMESVEKLTFGDSLRTQDSTKTTSPFSRNSDVADVILRQQHPEVIVERAGKGRPKNFMNSLNISLSSKEESTPKQYSGKHKVFSTTNCSKEADNRGRQTEGRGSRSDDQNSLTPVIQQMAQRLDQLTADLQALQHSQPATSTFIHWGSSTCPPSSQLVYSGVVGNGRYDTPGSGTNYVCLTLSPVEGNMAGNVQLYGNEYHTHNEQESMDVVCAVCRTPRATSIMIPGTNVCVDGWQREYSGFLMSGLPSSAAGSEFVCADSKMEGRTGSNRQEGGGKDFFIAVAHCGALPCPPYRETKAITCVVCSK